MTERSLVLDTSAVFAILLDEPDARTCQTTLADCDRILLSAPTLTEMLIVASGKDRAEALDQLLELLRPEIIPLTAVRARAAADAYRRWGKRFHRASLNLADSFAYALAMEHRCPLLFVGDDFARTDVGRAV